MIAMLASRFIFPRNDSHIKQYIDNRTPAEKYRDIISIINGKLDPFGVTCASTMWHMNVTIKVVFLI